MKNKLRLMYLNSHIGATLKMTVSEFEKFYNLNKSIFDIDYQEAYAENIEDMKTWQHRNDKDAVCIWAEKGFLKYEW